MFCNKKNKVDNDLDGGTGESSKVDLVSNDLATMQGCVTDAIRRLSLMTPEDASIQRFLLHSMSPESGVTRLRMTARKVALLHGRGKIAV